MNGSVSPKSVYLGDGAYARTGRFEIVITAERDGETQHWIALEPGAMRRLVNLADEIWGPEWRPAINQ